MRYIPCHVPRFIFPLVIGIVIVEPMTDALVCDTLSIIMISVRTITTAAAVQESGAYESLEADGEMAKKI